VASSSTIGPNSRITVEKTERSAELIDFAILPEAAGDRAAPK
jgi:hypothetical protein